MNRWIAIVLATLAVAPVQSDENASNAASGSPTAVDVANSQSALREFERGRRIFRQDTFGDQSFWGGALQLHKAIAGTANGGTGPGVSPETALAVGLKVDVDALPPELRMALRKGEVNLKSPATTLALLKLNSVVGVRGFFDSNGERLQSVGITCALCHSTVDNSLRCPAWATAWTAGRTGSRRRQDHRALAARHRISSRLVLGKTDPEVRRVLRGWGPGKSMRRSCWTARLPGRTGRRRADPAGLRARGREPPHVDRLGAPSRIGTRSSQTSRWAAREPSSTIAPDDAARFPIAAANGFGEVRTDPDLVTSKLAALQLYQLVLSRRRRPARQLRCGRRRAGQEPSSRPRALRELPRPAALHRAGTRPAYPAEIGIDAFQAERSPTDTIGLRR